MDSTDGDSNLRAGSGWKLEAVEGLIELGKNAWELLKEKVKLSLNSFPRFDPD